MGLIQILTDPGSFAFYKTDAPNGGLDPRAIPYGRDRVDGSESGQPYIQKTSNAYSAKLSKFIGNEDFIIRGGARAIDSSLDDVARLTKYMFNPKSPSGYLFIVKQNLLSLIAPKTEASKGLAYAGGAINEGIYSPLSTIAQAGGNAFGVHLNKQGIDPTGLIPQLKINKYGPIVWKKDQQFGLTTANEEKKLNKVQEKINALNSDSDIKAKKKERKINQLNEKQEEIADSDKNRLISLLNRRIYTINPGKSILRAYQGGPGAPYGVGWTSINFATDPDGNPVRTNDNTKTSFGTPLKSYAWSSDNFDAALPYKGSTGVTGDFRSFIPLTPENKTFLFATPGYSPEAINSNNIETKFNLGNPGQKGDITDYKKGKIIGSNTKSVPLDKVTAFPIYKSSTGVRPDSPELKDIIDFNIAILNNDQQGPDYFKKYIHFRAFIDSFSDSYSAEWKNLEYMGRGEKFYKYGGFDRDISMAFTAVAQSKDELSVMYDKLNFLASSLAPEYLDTITSGYMTGNIAYLTIGRYIIDQPGIIRGFTFDIPEETPWEIESSKQLPHMIKVTGFKFTPIHKFRPETVRFPIQPSGETTNTFLGESPIFQKYIDQNRRSITTINGDTTYDGKYPSN